MAKQKQQMFSSTLFCSECDTKMIIPRKKAQKREHNHVKHMYCYTCKKEQAFIEKQEDSRIAFWEQYHEQV